jgi:serralysin
MATFIPSTGDQTAGNDTIRGSARTDWLGKSPTASPDELSNAFIYNYQDTIYGYGGDDLIIGDRYDTGPTPTFAADRLYGGMGNDTIYSDHGPENPGLALIEVGGAGYSYGGEGNDVLFGGGSTDVLHGDDGDDVLVGFFGGDYLAGGAGNDSLYGGRGDDWGGLEGGDGDDKLYGGNGKDRLYGGFGNDTIYGDAGNDDIEGDAKSPERDPVSIDTLSYVFVGAAVRVNLANPFPQATGGAGRDIIAGIERLIGSDFGDTLSGSEAAQIIEGGGGDDIVRGRGGGDVLAGDGGMDMLFGDAGRDTLTGGDDADVFRFGGTLGTATVDTVTDYQTGLDTFGLDAAAFAAVGDFLEAGEFHLGTRAQDADDRIMYDAATGRLFYDADGTGAGKVVLVAFVGERLDVTAGEFLVF